MTTRNSCAGNNGAVNLTDETPVMRANDAETRRHS